MVLSEKTKPIWCISYRLIVKLVKNTKLPSCDEIMGILFLGSLVSFGYSQNLTSKAFGVENGLPFHDVTSIAEDSLGYLWVGTNGGGIARFDGKEFLNFGEENGLVNNAIINLYIDGKGKLWITTARGLSMYDGKIFENFIQDSEVLTFAYVFEFHDTIFAYQPSLGGDPAFAKVEGKNLLRKTTFISREVDSSIRAVLPISTETIALLTRQAN
ncbi:MAG: two-component regulator propeller domain-containing protein [Cytophagales bacterium]|nr:two-component regulator propeller domain-containing protein [Cytophagales bacterium]